MKIIIEGYNKSIHKRDNQLLIMEKEIEIDKVNINKIDDINIVGKGLITFDALRLISKNNIPVISIDYFGNIDYLLEYPNETNIFIKKRQYKLSDDYNGLYLAREIISAKLLNQKACIRTLNKNKNLDHVKDSIIKIDEYLNQLKNMRFGPNINVENSKLKIMGIEGKASTEYWSSISKLLPSNLGFKKRINRHPTDITNAMLNYAYAILASEVAKILVLNGLDSFCGFLHFDRDKRNSLIFDVIEEFRQQIVDKVVFSLLNTKQIGSSDLDNRNNTIKLDKRKLIVSKILDKLNSRIKYMDKNLTYLEIIDLQVKQIIEYILNGTKYNGFYLRW